MRKAVPEEIRIQQISELQNIEFIELLQGGCYSSKNFLFILQIHFVVQQTMEII